MKDFVFKFLLLIIALVGIITFQSFNNDMEYQYKANDNNIPEKLYNAHVNSLLIQDGKEIKVIKDRQSIAFLTEKKNDYFTRMYVVQLEKGDMKKLKKLKDFIGKIRITDKYLFVTIDGEKFTFTVENTAKNNENYYYAIGISEHKGLFEILKKRGKHLNDILINHAISKLPLSKID